MRLYLTPTSPFARKVHVALLEKGVACEYVYVQLADPVLASLNPLGKVPTLVRDDGTALYDSAVILQYLEGFGRPLFPTEPAARVEALRWEALCDGLCDALVATVVERRRGTPDPGFLAGQEAKVRRALATLQATLPPPGRFDVAQIALVATLTYVELRAPGLLGEFPGLAARLRELEARASVQESRKGG